MDPIKNAGVNDYAMTMPQQNNVQQTPEEDYSSMPMVYDPAMEEKKESASSGLALKALGAVGIAGLAFWAGHSWGSKGAKLAKEAKEAAVKAKDEAVKAKDAAVKAKDEALAKAKKLQDANDAAYEIADKGEYYLKRNLRKDVKKALRPDEAEAKKIEEKVSEGAKKAEGEAKAEGAEKAEETK